MGPFCLNYSERAMVAAYQGRADTSVSSDRKSDRCQDGDNQDDGQNDDQDAVLDDSRREQRRKSDSHR